MTRCFGLTLVGLSALLGCQGRLNATEHDDLPPGLSSAVSALEVRATNVSKTWAEAELRFLGAKHQFERAENLDRFRAETGDSFARSLDYSESMSTRAFRAMLTAQGVDLAGKDIDHIVPHSLGGADHPANYQILPSSQNRSLQDTFDSAKCAATKGRCAGAIAVSRKCGSFRDSDVSLL